MGRRKDAPDVQAAKGYPSKRKASVDKQLARAAELATLMATAPAEPGDKFAPPLFLDKRFAAALAIWRDYAPRLVHFNLLHDLDRHTFALFCVYMGEWVAANEEILAKGYSVRVKTVSGSYMPRLNPNVGRRDEAAKQVLELSKRFGLTPLDRASLFRDKKDLPAGLFGASLPQPAASNAAAAPAAPPAPEAIGGMDGFDSAPPGVRPN